MVTSTLSKNYNGLRSFNSAFKLFNCISPNEAELNYVNHSFIVLLSQNVQCSLKITDVLLKVLSLRLNAVTRCGCTNGPYQVNKNCLSAWLSPGIIHYNTLLAVYSYQVVSNHSEIYFIFSSPAKGHPIIVHAHFILLVSFFILFTYAH